MTTSAFGACTALADKALEFLAVGIYVTAIYTSLLFAPFIALRLWLGGPLDVAAWAAAAALLLAAFTPLPLTTGRLSRAFVRFSCSRAAGYFPARVVCEDEEAFKPGQGYLVGCVLAARSRRRAPPLGCHAHVLGS